MANCAGIDREAPSSSVFEVMYPNYADDPRVPLFIEDGKAELSFKCLCQVWQKAVFLYALHSLVMSSEAGIGAGTDYDNQIQRHAVDDVSTTFFENPSHVDDSASGFGATPYGRELLELIKKNTNIGVLNTGMIGRC